MHDWLTGFRGGERILEAFCEMYPEAPIYTLIHKKGSTSPIIESREIHTSFLDKIPGIYKYYRYFLPLMPLAASLLKIKHDADIVLSSSHCVIKGVKKPKGSKHICYLHTPMRYIYDQFDSYFRRSNIFVRTAGYILRPFLRWWDKKSNKNVDLFIPNSKFVQKRVQEYYEVTSSVVYPFVQLDDFKEIENKDIQKEDFYIMVTAFAPNKRVDLAIKAFNENGNKLKIIGSGSPTEVEYLKKIAKPNIEFLGHVSREVIVDQLSKAKAFIFPGIEDFGIAPLEALACGTPVVAFKAGGALETLNENISLYFEKKSPANLNKAIKILNSKKINIKELNKRAKYFSKEKFRFNLKRIINNLSAY